MWVLPFLVLQLIWLRSTRSWLSAAAVGGTVALAFYVFSYLGLFAATLVGVFMIVDLLSPSSSGVRLRALMRYVGATIVGYAGLFPALLAGTLLPSGFTASFIFTKEYFYGSRLTDYLLPSVHHPVLGRLVEGDSFPPHAGESVVFFGFSVLALAVFAVLARRRAFSGENNDSERAFIGSFAIVLVSASACYFRSRPTRRSVASVPLPDAAFILGSFVDYWKIYSRFAVLAGVGLVILASLGLNILLQRRRTAALGAACCVALIFELLPGAPVPAWSLNRHSPTVTWLQAHPGGIVAHYPMLPYWEPLVRGRSEEWSSRVWTVLFDQTRHRHPLYAIPSLPMDGTAARGNPPRQHEP